MRLEQPLQGLSGCWHMGLRSEYCRSKGCIAGWLPGSSREDRRSWYRFFFLFFVYYSRGTECPNQKSYGKRAPILSLGDLVPVLSELEDPHEKRRRFLDVSSQKKLQEGA